MPFKKSKAEFGKENGSYQVLGIQMKDAKASIKRNAKNISFKEPKKARKGPNINNATPTECASNKVGSGRQAAQNLDFAQETVRFDKNACLLPTKEDAVCDTEREALLQTAYGMPSINMRRLGDFSIVDKDGNLEPVQAVSYAQKDLFLSGMIYSYNESTVKDSGRRVQNFGPLRSFAIDASGKAAAIILSTDAARYTVIRPSVAYKKIYSNLSVQADIFYEVFQALSPQHGGNARASLEEILARLARSKAAKGFSTPREGLLLNGKFILAHLARLDSLDSGSSSRRAFKFTETDFANGLTDALIGFTYIGVQGCTGAVVPANGGGGIVIREPSLEMNKAMKNKGGGVGGGGEDSKADLKSDAQIMMEADEDFARQLQARMDVEAASGQRCGAKNAQAYIKVSEEEIADDYPPPAAYNKEEEETDELLLFDEDMAEVDPEYLPRRVLEDFSIYNAEGLLSSLELLPMSSRVDLDVDMYASGVVVEDDGDFSGAQALADPASGSGSGGTQSAPQTAGMRLYLSQIREWVVEFGADLLFISIRTDVAWYRLSTPAACYKPWFSVVLKCARIAARVLGMLSEESRASKLSFADVVKRLAKDEEMAPTFVSKKTNLVERFLTVHGEILLNCFSNYPVKEVSKCAFTAKLRERMNDVRHAKLYQSGPKKSKSGVNRNPMKDRAAGARSKPMTATATTMVKSIWQAYFQVSQRKAGDGEDAVPGGAVGEVAQEIEEDLNEEDNEEEESENALAESASKASRKAAPGGRSKKKNKSKQNGCFSRSVHERLAWSGASTAADGGSKAYSAVQLDGVNIALGDAIILSREETDDGKDEFEEEEEIPDAPLGLVQALWQDASGAKHVQLRLLVHGADTVLGDAASDSEVFLTTYVVTRSLTAIVGRAQVRRLTRNWDSSRRGEYFKEDQELRQRNEEAAVAGQPLELFWRRQYVPEEGMFRDPPADLFLGVRLPGEGPEQKGGEEGSSSPSAVRALEDGTGFVKGGVTYHQGDFMFVGPEVFDQMPETQREVNLPEYLANSRFHKGSHVGLRAWGIGRLVKLGAAESTKKTAREGKQKSVTTITLQRYWRPEDISDEASYRATSYYDIFAGNENLTVDVQDVVGPVRVVPAGTTKPDISTFVCVGSFDRKSKKFGEPPAEIFPTTGSKQNKTAATKGKGKGSGTEFEDGVDMKWVDGATDIKGKCKGKAGESNNAFPGDDGVALSTMDIFAGCGGLSEGMHQAGAAYTKWAIEYEEPAAEAFKLNNPHAAVFCNNCNVLLHSAMVKAGQENDCLASDEAVEASKTLAAEDRRALPVPGEVDFICGGPPCQGYSGMNRFNKGNWSMVQNSMVMSFLSYADFYRPRYFLLENVRNFVSHNKSFTFRLTVRSLLDMGYQVRFGVLNAGNFGVSQSRKRTFIWAAAPGELLPDWPILMHSFRTPQLSINLPGNVQYRAVPQTIGAPLRPVTVRDAIGDLPPIVNGQDAESMQYGGHPVSAFQKAIRGECTMLHDHISKQMNELNLERCRCIPKDCPGADWRVLEDIVRQDPSREKFKGQPLVPWCLPNTADRHNGWRGLFGRLDWLGHFPTSTTDPQPMGKVGQVFHPEQDRIVSVRECARAQGFPDKHRFYGNVHSKHRQVGNAVPPPLAAALGRQLRKALEQHSERESKAVLEAQMAV